MYSNWEFTFIIFIKTSFNGLNVHYQVSGIKLDQWGFIGTKKIHPTIDTRYYHKCKKGPRTSNSRLSLICFKDSRKARIDIRVSLDCFEDQLKPKGNIKLRRACFEDRKKQNSDIRTSKHFYERSISGKNN
jgi:hypothetical protein